MYETPFHDTRTRYLYAIHVWDTGMCYVYEIPVCDTRMRYLYAIRVWDTGMRYLYAIRVSDTGMRYLYAIRAWDTCMWYRTAIRVQDSMVSDTTMWYWGAISLCYTCMRIRVLNSNSNPKCLSLIPKVFEFNPNADTMCAKKKKIVWKFLESVKLPQNF